MSATDEGLFLIDNKITINSTDDNINITTKGGTGSVVITGNLEMTNTNIVNVSKIVVSKIGIGTTEPRTGLELYNTDQIIYRGNYWTQRVAADTTGTQKWTSICYGMGLFVAVAYSGSGSTVNANVMTSTDGINWNIQTGLPGKWSAICFGAGLFVAISSSLSTDAETNTIMISRDGINWTMSANLGTKNIFKSICYGAGRYVAVGNSNKILVSIDGITWTYYASPDNSGSTTSTLINFTGVCYGNGIFVTVSSILSPSTFKTSIMISIDGITWIHSNYSNSTSFNAICYGNGKFVAVSSTLSNLITTSSDGINWTVRTYPAGLSSLSSVCYGSGLFVALISSGVSSDVKNIINSDDGINWIIPQTFVYPNTLPSWQMVCYGNGIFAAISNTDTDPKVMTSGKQEYNALDNIGGQGIQGPTGLQGPTGQGEQGTQGPTGLQGPTGQGIQGEQGPTGPSTNFDILPTVLFGTASNTSTKIYIPITAVSQEYTPSFAQAIPTIVNSNFVLDYNNTSSVYTPNQNILTTNPFDYRFFKPLFNDPNKSNYIQTLSGIIITKDSYTGTNPSYQTFKYANGTTGSVWAYVHQISNLNTSLQGTPNKIKGQYSNYAESSTQTSVDIGTFTAGTPPSSDAILVINGNPTAVTVVWDITPPTQTNTDGEEGITISSYTVNYSTPGSDLRYDSPIPHDPAEQTTSLLSSTYTSLFPDSTYTFKIKSTNSLGLASDFNSQEYTATTSYLNPEKVTIESSSWSYSHTILTAYQVVQTVGFDQLPGLGGNQSVNVINNHNNSTSPIIVSQATGLSIQYNYSVRGKNADDLMNIGLHLNNNSGPTKSFKGFPLIPSGSVISDDITLNYGATTDQYSDDAQKGFYSKLSGFNVAIPVAQLNSDGTNNTVSFTQNYYYSTDKFNTEVIDYNQSFYYDTLVGDPSFVNNTDWTLNTQPTQISGVSIIGTNPSFNVTNQVSNLFKYFYVFNLLTYTFTGGATGTVNEPDLSKCTTSPPTDGSTVTFENDTVATTIADSFNKAVSLQMTAKNLNGSTESTTYIGNIIFDKPSYTLIQSSVKNPSTIQNISTAANPGYRVSVGPIGNTINNNCVFPSYGYNNEISSTQLPYSHNWSIISTAAATVTVSGTNVNIDASKELQIFNGSYQSVASNTTFSNNVIGYANYGIYESNEQVDYSSVSTGSSGTVTSNYRFAKFIWNYAGNLNTASYTNFVFTFVNFKRNGSAPTVATNASTGIATLSSDPNRLMLYYRTEQDTSSIIPSSSKFSSVWVDANSKFGTTESGLSTDITAPSSITSSNYYVNQDTEIKAPTSTSWSYSSNNLVVTTSAVLYGPASNNRNIQALVGLPMNSNYSFEYMTLHLSS